MLSIGSVVYLKEGKQKLMIINRGPIIEIDGQNTMFDYSGCLYPQGMVGEEVFYFNEENIDKILFEGYEDDEEERFKEVYDEWIAEHQGEFIKGKVEEKN